MILSLCLNAVMLFAFVICMMYTLGDLEQVQTTPTGLPILEVYWQATKNKHGSNFLVVGLAVILLIAQFNAIASVSRLIWSFSTDKGLPFPNVFAYVSVHMFPIHHVSQS